MSKQVSKISRCDKQDVGLINVTGNHPSDKVNYDGSDITNACAHAPDISSTCGAVSGRSIAHTQPSAVRANRHYCAHAHSEEIDRRARAPFPPYTPSLCWEGEGRGEGTTEG